MKKEEAKKDKPDEARNIALFVIATLFRAADVAGSAAAKGAIPMSANDSFVLAEGQLQEAEARGVSFEQLTG